jgi:hypothetical protein
MSGGRALALWFARAVARLCDGNVKGERLFRDPEIAFFAQPLKASVTPAYIMPCARGEVRAWDCVV